MKVYKKVLIAVVLIGIFASTANAVKFIAKGATSQSITVVINDADGDPNTAGVTIANLDLYIQRDGYPQSAVYALATHDNDHDGWDDLEAFHMGNGLYRIDIPDANLDDPVGTMLTYVIDDMASNNRTSYYEVQLSPPVDVDLVVGATPQSAATLTTAIWAKLMVDLGAAAPSPTANIFNALNWVYSMSINKQITNGTNSEIEYYNNAGTKIAEAPYSDDGTSFTKDKAGVID